MVRRQPQYLGPVSVGHRVEGESYNKSKSTNRKLEKEITDDIAADISFSLAGCAQYVSYVK